MSAMQVTVSPEPTGRMYTDFPIQSWESGTARFLARWGRAGSVIAVHGEIDAANADQFAEQLHRCVTGCEWLVLDFSDLEFLGTAGFSALRRINTRCIEAQVSWALVAGLATQRVLRVCDPDVVLPTSPSTIEALTAVQDSHRLLHLIT